MMGGQREAEGTQGNVIRALQSEVSITTRDQRDEIRSDELDKGTNTVSMSLLEVVFP